jgi:hypothetical protein
MSTEKTLERIRKMEKKLYLEPDIKDLGGMDYLE